MTIKLQHVNFEGKLYNNIFDGFNQQAKNQTGIDNYWGEEICLSAVDISTNIHMGLIFYLICGGQLWIYQLFVKEEFRKKGVGKILIQSAIDYAEKNNCDYIYLETMSFHNIGFYKKYGFKEDFRREKFKGNASWIYMSKQIK